MKPSKKLLFFNLLFVTVMIVLTIFGCGDKIKGVQQMRFGIDIRGGVEAIFEPNGIDRKATEAELESAKDIIETRLDNKNITDREVMVDQGGGYIIVRFPWKSGEKEFNPEQAITEIGEMAELTFQDSEGNVLVKGKNVENSSAQQVNNNGKVEYMVSLSFDAEGSKLFEKATEAMVGKTIGIYMDDKLISNPTVESKITGGQAVINNMSSYEEAKELSDKINAGSLPFSLKTTNFSTISPSLGNTALSVMVIAGLVAFSIVCLFMIIIYKLPGIVSCIVLVLQMALQLLAISVPQYTLTLPGIAGIILSLGMAVDANIIISERITDEIGKGYSIRRAIKSGYNKAFSSVLDGNVTTAIVAVILMLFGSGAMLSFGYTLLIGMIVNVAVGVTVSKKILQSLMEFKKLNDEKYFKKYKEKKTIGFYKKKVWFVGVSTIIFAVGLIACWQRGVKLDTQFTGGVVLNYTVSGEIDSEKINSLLEEELERPVTVQITKDTVTNGQKLVITLAGKEGITPSVQKGITELLNQQNNGGKVTLSQTFVVQPYIGARALKNAGIAIALAVLFIVIYVWIRFSGLAAGVTATIALIHDVLVVFFAFVVFAIPLNDAFVAVVLTILGYSINDTIVLYDRIRENQKNNGKKNIIQLVNESITQTFTRSVNTSITTCVCAIVVLIAAVLYKITSIEQFALPMVFGLVSGCYSSICIAGTIWAGWEKRKEKK